MNSTEIQTLPTLKHSGRLQNVRSFLSLQLFLGLVLLLKTAELAHAAFAGPYGVTPPAAASYFVLAPNPQNFGAWTALPTSRGERVDTTLAPLSLGIDPEAVFAGGGYFFTRAIDSGVVSFEYTISGKGVGYFGWFNS